jgi:hypothetical protein
MYPQRKSMVRQPLRLWLPGSIGLILLALAYRLRPKPLIDAVRVWNKHVTNPPIIALAGRRNWYAAVIRHEGRRSGKEYATPVKAVPVQGGFVVPLSYGEGVEGLRTGGCRAMRRSRARGRPTPLRSRR